MRRIFNTTTAIMACLSMIAPQLAMAQAQQEQGQEQPVLPKHKKAAPAEDAQAQTPKQRKAEQQERKARQQQSDQTETPRKPRRETAEEQQNAEQPPAQTRREGQPEKRRAKAVQAGDEQPQAKPPLTQAEEPRAKPPVVEAEVPRDKPADAQEAASRAEQLQQESKKQPAAKPDTAKAVTTADPAPDRKPRQKDAQKTDQPPTEQTDSPDADALKKALEAQAQGEAKPQPDEADQNTPPRQRDQAREQQAQDPQIQAQRAAEGQSDVPDTAELTRRLQDQQVNHGAKGERPGKPGELQPGEVEAPEARVQTNDVARRAAEILPPAAAAALAAGDQARQGKLNQVQITESDARRSDQDFETAITQQMQGRTDPQREARRDDDDDNDNLKDIGKLLLAGAAGLAVGKMLSNDRQVALNTGDRVVVTLPDGSQQVIKDDNALLYQPGSNVQTETFDDGSTRTTVLRADGSRVVTIRDADMNILRRTLVRADGSETRLIDDTEARPVRISTLPAPPPVEITRSALDEAALREALRREAAVDRRFTLGQIRDIPEVRALVAPVNVPEITFDTGSSAITPDQARQLATLGKVIRDSVAQDPREIYMIEGYTDAVGSDAANLALSDRRAESVALALTEYFQVPPENMVVQGYGEQFLLVPSEGAERDNRRVAVRRITDLMEQN